MSMSGTRIGFALTGSHCTIPLIWAPLRQIKAEGADLFPIVSRAVAETDTRFGRAVDVVGRLQRICGREPWSDLVEVEAIGPQKLFDLLIVAPCTGNTMAKLAHGIADTPVTLACKAQLRNERPVLLAISTNDGLSGNVASLAVLLERKHFYFVPFGQDSPENKANSLVARMEALPRAAEAALANRQLEPLLVQYEETPKVIEADRS